MNSSLFSLDASCTALEIRSLPAFLQYFREMYAARSTMTPSNGAVHNPQLLLVLAEEEMEAGRSKQAVRLLEAAYSAFDNARSAR